MGRTCTSRVEARLLALPGVSEALLGGMAGLTVPPCCGWSQSLHARGGRALDAAAVQANRDFSHPEQVKAWAVLTTTSRWRASSPQPQAAERWSWAGTLPPWPPSTGMGPGPSQSFTWGAPPERRPVVSPLLALLTLYTPGWVKGQGLRRLFAVTAEGFQVPLPDRLPRSHHQLLELYARFTAQQAVEALCSGRDLDPAGASLRGAGDGGGLRR